MTTYVGMSVEQSLHYCLSDSMMPQLKSLKYGQLLCSNVGLLNCHPYIAIFIWDNFFFFLNACSHYFFSFYVGGQHPLAKYLAISQVSCLEQLSLPLDLYLELSLYIAPHQLDSHSQLTNYHYCHPTQKHIIQASCQTTNFPQSNWKFSVLELLPFT